MLRTIGAVLLATGGVAEPPRELHELPAARPPHERNAAVSSWPVRGAEPAAYVQGARVLVRVASKRSSVRLSLVKVRSDGTAVRTISKRRVRRATVRFELTSTGTYALRAKVGTRNYWSWLQVDDCAATTGDRAELRLDRTTVRAGETIGYAILNTTTSCIGVGEGYSFERQQSDGTWSRVPTAAGFPLSGILLGPGKEHAKQAVVPPELAAGRYRLVDSATGPVTPQGPDARLHIRMTAPLDVVP